MSYEKTYKIITAPNSTYQKGGGWVHGLGVYGLEKCVLPASIGLDFYLRPEAVATRKHILAGVTLLPHLNNPPRAVVGAGGQQEQEQ